MLHGLYNSRQSGVVVQQALVAGVDVRLLSDPLLDLGVTIVRLNKHVQHRARAHVEHVQEDACAHIRRLGEELRERPHDVRLALHEAGEDRCHEEFSTSRTNIIANLVV